jgi:hypothetical protein
MDPCHINTFSRVLRTKKKRSNDTFNASFEKDIQSINRFLVDVEYSDGAADLIRKWWSDLVAYKIKTKYGL